MATTLIRIPCSCCCLGAFKMEKKTVFLVSCQRADVWPPGRGIISTFCNCCRHSKSRRMPLFPPPKTQKSWLQALLLRRSHAGVGADGSGDNFLPWEQSLATTAQHMEDGVYNFNFLFMSLTNQLFLLGFFWGVLFFRKMSFNTVVWRLLAQYAVLIDCAMTSLP